VSKWYTTTSILLVVAVIEISAHGTALSPERPVVNRRPPVCASPGHIHYLNNEKPCWSLTRRRSVSHFFFSRRGYDPNRTRHCSSRVIDPAAGKSLGNITPFEKKPYLYGLLGAVVGETKECRIRASKRTRRIDSLRRLAIVVGGEHNVKRKCVQLDLRREYPTDIVIVREPSSETDMGKNEGTNP
jgi:hypothetical protein